MHTVSAEYILWAVHYAPSLGCVAVYFCGSTADKNLEADSPVCHRRRGPVGSGYFEAPLGSGVLM